MLRNLNKGEAKHALARTVFFNRLGALRDWASGLNLVVAALVLWNTMYLEQAVAGLKAQGLTVDDILLPHLAPLGWEHINLTGDEHWRQSKHADQGHFRGAPEIRDLFTDLGRFIQPVPSPGQGTAAMPLATATLLWQRSAGDDPTAV